MADVLVLPGGWYGPTAPLTMYVPGPMTGSVAVLGRVVAAVDEYLDGIGWPG